MYVCMYVYIYQLACHGILALNHGEAVGQALAVLVLGVLEKSMMHIFTMVSNFHISLQSTNERERGGDGSPVSAYGTPESRFICVF
jgi:Mn2+/Fe2+ NRAMP family transporter